MLASKPQQLLHLGDDGSPFGATDHGDAPTPAELEESLVAEQAQRTKDGVAVDTEHSGKVDSGWESLTRGGFAVGDRAADGSGNLFVQERRVFVVNLDRDHSC